METALIWLVLSGAVIFLAIKYGGAVKEIKQTKETLAQVRKEKQKNEKIGAEPDVDKPFGGMRKKPDS